ncbi:MAG: primosomal protein N' [Anaerolineales bacterium]|nr:primosomal protein N' [Anaerolineales bacterium]
MKFVQIAVNVPAVSGVFDYLLPENLSGQVKVGHLVTAPFGAQIVQGVILRFIAQPSVADPKEVLALLAPEPVLTAPQLALAEKLAEVTLNPLSAIIGLMLPVGLSQQADVLYEAVDRAPRDGEQSQGSVVRQRLLNLLDERGPLRGRQIDSHFRNVDWRKSAQALVRRGLLTSRAVLPAPRVRPKLVRTAQLAVPLEAAEAAMPDLGRTDATLDRRQAAMRFLMKELDEVNVSWVYAESGCNLADLHKLAGMDLILLRESEIWRDPLQRIEKGSAATREKVLTSEQENALMKIKEALGASARTPGPCFLFHGVTGSGKTEIYIRAAQEAARRGRQTILMVPEIALTPQTVRRFLVHFPGQVGLLHSRLSEGERYDTWRRARQGLLKVVIGPRSALFAPLPQVGLIVVDECHDNSYYQSEPPFYNAAAAARMYAGLCGAVCILGSATPSVEQRYQAENGEMVRLSLVGRITPGSAGQPARSLELPPIEVVDMREELKAGNREIFSRSLSASLTGVLERGEQAILFINRRGAATYVFCRECGYTLKCPHCEIPLTYHTQPANSDLRCHRCGYQRRLPATCPQCGSRHIRQYGLGSEKVETDLQQLFPRARVLRWDWETTRQKDAHEIILSHFVSGRADVLVGTQMLAKGLDIPRVTLVGVVLADVGLNFPDPFAAERGFQLLTQVAGRAGRSELGGRVVLQTFQPDHYAIRYAAGHDVEGFYQQELAYRRELGYPPYRQLVRLEYRSRDENRAEAEAHKLGGYLVSRLEKDRHVETDLIGPAPAFFSRAAGVYRWQVVLRGPSPVDIIKGLLLEHPNWLKDWRVEVDPVSLL